jgi:hypothetical protein
MGGVQLRDRVRQVVAHRPSESESFAAIAHVGNPSPASLSTRRSRSVSGSRSNQASTTRIIPQRHATAPSGARAHARARDPRPGMH